MSTVRQLSMNLYTSLAEARKLNAGALSREAWLEVADSAFAPLLEAQLEMPARARGGRYPSCDEWVNLAKIAHPQWPSKDAANSWRSYEAIGWKRGKTAIINWRVLIDTCFEYWAAEPQNAEAANRKPAYDAPKTQTEPAGWVAWVRDNLPENWRGFSLEAQGYGLPVWSSLTNDERKAISEQMKGRRP